MSENIIYQQTFEDVHLILFNQYQDFGLILIKKDQHQGYIFCQESSNSDLRRSELDDREGDFWYLEDAFDVENNFPIIGYLLESHPLASGGEGWILMGGYEYLRKWFSKIKHITLYQKFINYESNRTRDLEKTPVWDIFEKKDNIEKTSFNCDS